MNTNESGISTAAHLAAIVASSDDAIISKGLDSVILSWNEGAERIFGYSREEAIGQSILLIIPDDRYAEEEAIISRIKAGERVDHFETVRRRKSGELLTVSITVSPIKDAGGTIVGASKIARDVTHHKRTEELLRLASEAAEVGLWDVDIVGDTLFWDARCKAMFGISPDVPVTLADFYTGLHPDDIETTTRAYLASQDPDLRALYDVEYRTIGREDGVVRWIAAKGRGIFDHNGRCIRTVGTTLDITTRKESERRRDVMSKLTELVQSMDSETVLHDACALMGQHFEAARVGIGDLHKHEDVFNYTICWTDGTVPPLLGEFPAHIFGVKIVERLSAGKTVVIGDLFDDPLSAEETTIETAKEVDTRAILVVPFLQANRLRSIVYLNARLPRRWKPDDVTFMQTFADRLRQLAERQRSEAALAASEVQFRTLAEAMPNHVWMANAQGVSDWYNDEAHNYTGMNRGALTSESWIQLVHPDDWDNIRSAWLAAVEAAGIYKVEMRIRRADGVYRWHLVRAVPIHGSDGRIVRWIGTNTDIDDQKAAVQAYAELNANLEQRVADALAERKLFADIVESTDAFVQVADLDFNWLAINKASADEFERIFGIRPKAGDNMLALLDGMPEHQADVKAIWSRALAGEQFTAIDDFGDPNLDRRYYEMKFNALRDTEGRLIGAYQFVYDVTARLRDEARLAEAEEQLRQAQKMEAVGQLTGGIAHDFNNMLAVVSGSLELLDRRTRPDEQRSKTLISAALEASRRAGNLTQRLLAFSRRQPLRPEIIDPNKLVLGMSELFRHSLGTDIRLETILAGGIWRIFADANQLESVLLNLAVNSRDAMPGGGRLTIETLNASLDQRYVATEAGVTAGQYVMIAVTDTGSGMPADVIAKAFDPFFTTKEVGKGTGLGLSQVYGFVKQSGGHIKIYSEPSQGTTVKIYLPRYAGNLEETADSEAHEGLPTAEDRELILVVDDEDLVRQFSVAALRDLDYRVLEASNAKTALALLIERPDIDLLFTDIVMPEMNGRQLVDIARERRPDLPVMYTTGYTRNAIVHNGVLDTGVELIGKPFTLEELATRIRAVLDKATLARKASVS
ncbi:MULTISPECIES: PAS domain S-box protein [Asticcacaulis]|uniref:PAS domain S-box protein n=1 Tax=Asticcacaulis TaxID=76890 RepID=UPI001FD94F63|nr:MULTISPECIES: PAS domain S-box protein [Asticcacaulis]MBP2159092.1 PAS domain S-box-containing protein [Asticcacaulis solisilvae]MDR6800137.1 PAS domain S-box-containing protein [Asticcacaulis sp. BE141]